MVEDSATQAERLMDLLEGLGHEVDRVETGEEALQWVSVQPPDLIVLDRALPGIDGFHVCAALREDPATHGIPILMLTSDEGVPSELASLRAGADDFLTKGGDAAHLVARIERLLERARTHRRVSDMERLDLLQRTTRVLMPGFRGPLRKARECIHRLEAMDLPEEDHYKALRCMRAYVHRIEMLIANLEKVSSVACETFVARQDLGDLERALVRAEEEAHSSTGIGHLSRGD